MAEAKAPFLNYFVRTCEGRSVIAIGCSHAATAVPERIDPGNRSWTLATTPKIVSGIDDGSLAAVQSFYRGIVDQTVAVSSLREAELAKLIENTFRHVNMALMNELAMFGREASASTCGRRSTQRPPSRSGSCRSIPDPE